MIRIVDQLGRVSIPKRIQSALDIKYKDPIDVAIVDENNILVTRIKRGCVFCNKLETLHIIKNKLVCDKCLNNLKKLGGNENE